MDTAIETASKVGTFYIIVLFAVALVAAGAIWSKKLLDGSVQWLKDTLKRPITTIPPSITTTHHDGGLPSPLSYTLADDNPPLPSTRIQRSRHNLRERRQFRNDGWTKWKAVQLTDELEATQEMVKADWESWKKLEELFK